MGRWSGVNSWQALMAAVVVVLVVAVGYVAVSGRSGGATVSTVVSTVVVEKTVTTTVPETVTLTTATTSTISRTVVATSTVTRQVTETVTATVERTRIVLVDALGRRVELEGSAERVVSLAPSITETILMLNMSSKLVGVDSFSKKMPGVPENVVDVGGFWQPSPEKIAEARPDLVLACSGVPRQEALAEQLAGEGFKVFFLRCDRARDWRDIEWDTEAVATLLGNVSAGERLVAWMEERLARLAEALTELNESRPSTALIVYLSPNGIWVAGGGTFQDTMISTAWGSNVYHSLYGWQMVSYEDLASKNPETLLLTAPDKTGAAKALEKLEQTPLAGIRAWKSGRVCVLYGPAADAVSRPSPRAVYGAELLAVLLHPAINGTLDTPKELLGGTLCGPQHG